MNRNSDIWGGAAGRSSSRCHVLAGRRRRITFDIVIAWLGVSTLFAGASRGDQPLTILDAPEDAVIRRTDLGADGFIDPGLQRLPDLLQIRMGKFAPDDPSDDRFTGSWDDSGGFARVDLVFEGVVNPPGPVGLSDHSPVYDPFKYGPNPVVGFIEFDMDDNVDTGGELNAPQYRYLGNVARFGGIPAGAAFVDRVARDGFAFDGFVTTPPFVDRSGEEFHWVLLGEEISSREVKRERENGIPAIFEAGEKWIVEGKLMHRAHGFGDFALMCFDAEGEYEAEVKLLFTHRENTDQTTISLVYPLTNTASASLQGSGTNVAPNDGCPDDQNSVEEGLVDLQFSATIADAGTRLLPEFQLIAGWEFETPADYLEPDAWRVTALMGTPYGNPKPDGSRFIWTDVYPSPTPGDFDGDGVSTPLDTQALNQFVAHNDGNAMLDADGDGSNGSILWTDFAQGFCVFDEDYDGVVVSGDVVVLGDMDINLVVDVEDIDDFVLALLDPEAYVVTHNNEDPILRGDVNVDGLLDSGDIQEFAALVLQQ
ncbi:MAG: hypothetical protein H6819_11300 [Phycisphaerales bacterium]|nr:hypothetical protein [Phycisphaerales bacterium]MCB9854563.1 hypothetical protein [Phycisphaerales bacterium]MCB9863218.1 hypothetical protein [Phycisphaerales bacterium]